MANQDQYILAVAIAFAGTVVGGVIVELNSHEEKVCRIRNNFVYMEIIGYMLDHIKWFSIETLHSVPVIVKIIDDSPPDLIIEGRQSD